MARKYVTLAELQETFKKVRREQRKVLKANDKYAGLRECFRNVRKCNDARHLCFCY